jgi:hypothetical protein
MSQTRFAIAASLGLAFILLPGLSRPLCGQISHSQPAQTRTPAYSAASTPADSSTSNDFAGLSYSEEQKAEIARIHSETESHKAVVVKDDKLTPDQKSAMLVGYTRMEYGSIYKVLSPEQRRKVRQRMIARRAAEQAQRKQAPPNPPS